LAVPSTPGENDPLVEITLGSYKNTARLATLFNGEPFDLESGEKMCPLQIAYETWGRLNEDGSNAVLIVHALTGDSHAASHNKDDREGWFEGVVGPGKVFDPEHHYIVCSNWLGSNYGSSGPTSINHSTGQPYRSNFPVITISDITRTIKALAEHLGIRKWLTMTGASIGGLIILDYAARFPYGLVSAIPIACAFRSGPWVIAFHSIMRRILSLGRDSGNDELYRRALETARMVGMVSYRSRGEFTKKLQRLRAELQWQEKGCSYAVESYLLHQGSKLDRRFDPTTYEYLTRAADSFDLAETHGSLQLAASRIRCKILAIGIDTDYLYPLEEQKEIVSEVLKAGGSAELGVISSENGHDGFLIEFDQLSLLISGFLGRLK